MTADDRAGGSYLQPTDLSCPKCGAVQSVGVPLLVDVTGPPDQVERIREGTIHTVTCQACEHVYAYDSPLLLYAEQSRRRFCSRRAPRLRRMRSTT